MAVYTQKIISELIDERDLALKALKQSTTLLEQAGGFADRTARNKTIIRVMGMGSAMLSLTDPKKKVDSCHGFTK